MTKEEKKEKRIKFWEEVLAQFVNPLTEDGGFCMVIRDVNRRLNTFYDCPYSYLESAYPELVQYKPKRLYKEDDRYWWSPYAKSGRVKRIQVTRQIINDLQKQL